MWACLFSSYSVSCRISAVCDPQTTPVFNIVSVRKFSGAYIATMVRFTRETVQKSHCSWQWGGDTLRACCGSTSCTVVSSSAVSSGAGIRPAIDRPNNHTRLQHSHSKPPWGGCNRNKVSHNTKQKLNRLRWTQNKCISSEVHRGQQLEVGHGVRFGLSWFWVWGVGVT